MRAAVSFVVVAVVVGACGGKVRDDPSSASASTPTPPSPEGGATSSAPPPAAASTSPIPFSECVGEEYTQFKTTKNYTYAGSSWSGCQSDRYMHTELSYKTYPENGVVVQPDLPGCVVDHYLDGSTDGASYFSCAATICTLVADASCTALALSCTTEADAQTMAAAAPYACSANGLNVCCVAGP